MEPPVDLRGRRIVGGRYRILHLIYSSTMSSVFKAWDHEQKKPVVIKIATNNIAIDCLRNEEFVLRRLVHPGIAQLVDVGNLDESHFLVLEYVRGLDVAHCFSSESPMSVDRAVLVLVGLLEILQYVNHSGFIHKDVKPENVMLTENGEVKLLDFGLAKPICAVGTGHSVCAVNVAGTLPFLSPEQARFYDLDCRSDLYSCGVMLFTMLAGKYPFSEYKKEGKIVPYWNSYLRAYPEVPFIPYDVRNVIDQALEVDPDRRFQSPMEMRLALQLAAEPESVEELVLGVQDMISGEITKPIKIVRSGH